MGIFDVLSNKRVDESEEYMANRLQYEWRSMVGQLMNNTMNRVTGEYKETKFDKHQAALFGQMVQLMEEQSELTKAMCKYIRACGLGQITEVDVETARNMIIEEIADTRFAQEHVMKLLGIKSDDLLRVNEKKIDKIIKRLDEKEEREKYEQN